MSTPPRGWTAKDGYGYPVAPRIVSSQTNPAACNSIPYYSYHIPFGAGSPPDTYTVVPPKPGPPSAVSATVGTSRTMQVLFSRVYSEGTSPVTSYVATATPAGGGPEKTCTAGPEAAGDYGQVGTGTGCTLSGVTNGVAYTVTVAAVNASGAGTPAGADKPATPVGVPDAPTGVRVDPRYYSFYVNLNITWVAPADTGGAEIYQYRVTATTAGKTYTCVWTTANTGGLACPLSVALGNNTYTVLVTAANSYGEAASVPISVSTGTPPPAPTGVTATAEDSAIWVAWTPPTTPYPGTITGYKAAAWLSGGVVPSSTCTTGAAGTGCRLTGLVNGSGYQIAAYTLAGEFFSPAALAPSWVTPASTPGIPAAVAASASDRAIAVTWGPTTEPNRTPAASYTATATPAAVNSFISPGSCTVAAPATTCTIPGLVNGAVYDVAVTAANAQGTSDRAGAALPVVPALTTVNLPTKVSAGNTYRLTAGTPDATLFANVTVTGAEGPGHLTTYPCRQGKPLASNHNFTTGVSRAVYTVVKADAAGDVCIFASATAHLIWDQGGDNLIAGAGGLSPVVAHSPVRKYDSRTVGAGARLPGGATVTIRAGTPGQTILGHVTVTQAAGIGYITAYPCAAGRPTASNLNYTAGATIPNLVAVAADANGDICLYTANATHLIWDQEMETAALSGHTPVRKLDTRTSADGAAKVPAGGIRRVHVGGAGQQVLGTLTVTAADGGGYTTVYTCSEPRPNASASNFQAGVTIANFAAARADANGDICLYTTATTHLIWDQSVEEAAASTDINVRKSPLRILDTRLNAASQG